MGDPDAVDTASLVFSTPRDEIEAAFGHRILDRPAFHNHPGGLRFRLSEGASPVESFLTALRTARLICEDVFPQDRQLMVCLSLSLPDTGFSGVVRRSLRQLARAGIAIPRARSMWFRPPQDSLSVWGTLHVAFRARRALLDNLLWCALASDLDIEPCPRCEAIHLMDPDRSVCVHPYDDRGMDVVGGNHALLSMLYDRHGLHLLDHDRQAMAATFGS